MSTIEWFVIVLPVLFLPMSAQLVITSIWADARRVPASISGYRSARMVLDAAGLSDVEIQQVAGYWTDHYDSRAGVLRLSEDVYHGRSVAAVGLAAHEAGHAIQQAEHFFPLLIRNVATTVSVFAGTAGIVLIVLGLALDFAPLLLCGGVVFGSAALLQLVNLPVEWNASWRAKAILSQRDILGPVHDSVASRVLVAVSLIPLCSMLQSLVVPIVHVLRFVTRRESVG